MSNSKLQTFISRKGYFITFEGIDFSGKSTQAQRLASYLESKGNNVTLTHEFGGTKVGEEIRKLILDPKYNLPGKHKLMLIMAQREAHLQGVIIPALADGQIVICDRYRHSTYAYQHYGQGIDLDTITYLETCLTTHLVPNLTLFLDIYPVDAAHRRAQAEYRRTVPSGYSDTQHHTETDMYEQLALSEDNFLRRVREGYVSMFPQDDDKCLFHGYCKVDARNTPDKIERTIREIVGYKLDRWAEIRAEINR